MPPKSPSGSLILLYGCLYKMHHLLNNGAEINQRDEKGFTPLHRAAYLSHYVGYQELYEYLLVGIWRPVK
jgi:ankyrin repeat protein